MKFLIPDSVYYPREDSLLMAKVIETLSLNQKMLLEIGCGSGFISILAAKKGALVTSIDINPVAVKSTEDNAKTNDVKLTTEVSDIFSKVNEKFDVIVFNPPYLPVEEGEDNPTYAGGPDGRRIIERFIEDVKKYLTNNGVVFLLISSLTGEKEVLELFKKQGMKSEIISREKIPWEELLIIQAVQ